MLTASGTSILDGPAGTWGSSSVYDARASTAAWAPISLESNRSISTHGQMSSYRTYSNGAIQEPTNTGRLNWLKDMPRPKQKSRTSSGRNTNLRDGSWTVQCQIHRHLTLMMTFPLTSYKRRLKSRDLPLKGYKLLKNHPLRLAQLQTWIYSVISIHPPDQIPQILLQTSPREQAHLPQNRSQQDRRSH